MSKEKIKICDRHKKQVPLIWTFEFSGSEWWCPACGFNGGMFGSGISVNLTKKLSDAFTNWKKLADEYLDARGTLICSSKEINGVDVPFEDIPKEEMDRCRKIVDEWKYSIK